MPLKRDIGFNIKELRSANTKRKKKRSKKQILAIALEAKKERQD